MRNLIYFFRRSALNAGDACIISGHSYVQCGLLELKIIIIYDLIMISDSYLCNSLVFKKYNNNDIVLFPFRPADEPKTAFRLVNVANLILSQLAS